MFADALLTGTVSQRSLQNSPLESSCVVIALIENYSTLKLLNVSPKKSQILSCETVVANEQYVVTTSSGALKSKSDSVKYRLLACILM
jgi:hypothetical protein